MPVGCLGTDGPCTPRRSGASAPGSPPTPSPARSSSSTGSGPAARTAADAQHRSAWIDLDQGPLGVNRSWQLFFEPVQLHLEPTDLLVELGLQGLMLGARRPWRRWLNTSSASGQRVASSSRGSASDERRAARQFVHRLVTLDRRQRHLGLERRRMGLPFPGHGYPFLWTANSSLFDCPVFGVHYTCSSASLCSYSPRTPFWCSQLCKARSTSE